MATVLDQAGDAGHDLRAPELSGTGIGVLETRRTSAAMAVFFRPHTGHCPLWAGRWGNPRGFAGPSSGTPTPPVPPTRLASGAVLNRN